MLPSHIKPQLATFEKTTHTLSPQRVVIPIKDDMNGFRNYLTLSHNEISTTKTDHKNEISTKNWVGSTWFAKSQRSKSMLVNGQSQRWSTVNVGQRSTRSSQLGLTWHLLTWH